MENNNGGKDAQKEKSLLELIINSKKFEWKEQYISGSEVRKLGNIPKEDKIFLDIERPWEDEIISDETKVDLARPGIEQFFSHKHEGSRLVEIDINTKPYSISRGKHTVVEIKKLGGVPQAHELEELINGKLVPLADDSSILIKGCEKFFSHVRDGSSS
ncbi:multiubiquitin domain-containing protein [Flavobacterium sp.]|uniref:multiubiquitin domain-containing protein n=1 Tax=Flavobacterium sp. TaxID=239 RepID=UPI002BF137C0|nr:multiubiquitin domain-containing protein [Flavobacterium sp.]HSD08860.1 multiubiquitin domain-containing protein [Flavobacterium sp.]